MSKCVDLEQLSDDIYNELWSYDNNKLSLQGIKDNLGRFISTTVRKNYDISNIEAVISAIQAGLFDYNDKYTKDDFFGVENLKQLIAGVKIDNPTDSPKDANWNTLQNTEVSTSSKTTSKFLENSYGLAKEVQRRAQVEIDSNLFDALFVNRGSILDISIGIVSNSTDLNNNIRQVKEQLFQKICAYLRDLNINFSKEELDIINNGTLFRLNGSIVEYTGAIHIIYDLLQSELGPAQYSPQMLRKLQESNDSKDQKCLAAYNAWVFLQHFDTYLTRVLGKAITIKSDSFNKWDGEDKYQISSNTAQLATTWRTDENFDPGKEVDAITKMLINTTPMYDWFGDKLEHRYLTFQNYQNIIGKIKAMGTNPIAFTIVFNDSFKDKYKTIWNSFSPELQRAIEGKRLSQVINEIRRNPRTQLHLIFEILCNPEFYNVFKTEVGQFQGINIPIYDLFNEEELKHIYSLYKTIFNSKDSFKTLVGIQPKLDYYFFLAQTSDSIFKNQFIQYYRDNSGKVVTKKLTDFSLVGDKIKVVSSINSRNSNKVTISHWDTIKTLYGIEQKGSNIYRFNIPDTDIIIEVNTITHTAVAKQGVNKVIWQNVYRTYKNQINDFLDQILGLGIQANTDFIHIFSEGNIANGINRLIVLASNVLANQYVSITFLKDKKRDEIESVLSTYFDKAVRYNKSLKQIDLVPTDKASAGTLEAIVRTRYVLKGLATSTQVKDSQQAGQNLQSLSRLLGSFAAQWDLIERRPDSVSKHFTLLNTPGLFIEHYTTSEYYDSVRKKSKKATKFIVSEGVYANIVSNYLPILLAKGNYDLIGDGYVSFLASVNSDKGTIGQLLFDLNTKVSFPNLGIEEKAVRDLTDQELKLIISEEFGQFYIGMLNSIQNDFNRLSKFIEEETGRIISFDYSTDFTAFNQLNISDPVNWLKGWIKSYNGKHRFNPIELVDGIHYRTSKVAGKTVLTNNKAIIQQIARFNPTEAATIYGINVDEYFTLDEFFAEKEKEIIQTLLNSKTVLNVSSTEQEELTDQKVTLANKIREQYPKWIDASENLIIAKVVIGGQSYDISSKKDLRIIGIQTGYSESDILNKATSIEINPYLRTYNYLDYWLTQSWMNTTVGSFVAHPGKKTANNIKAMGVTDIRMQNLMLEAAMYQEQNKRNVSMTAQMHEFSLNHLTGIPDTYNIAVIDDMFDYRSVLMKSGVKIKPTDGATFVNPFVVYLENNSLGGAKAGFDKKQFVHGKNGRLGTGIIIKTAGFGITNDRIRNSPDGWGSLMRQMTDITWLEEDSNNPYIVESLTKDFKGQNIEYKPIYFAHDGHQYEIVKIENGVRPNEFRRIIREINPTDPKSESLPLSEEELKSRGIESSMIIDSNYKLWQFFGGAFSLSLKEGQIVLTPSESSIENVVIAMNSIGTAKVNPENVETQDDLYQPLKHCQIHYMPTIGAVKHGSANTNPTSLYGTGKPVDFQRIKMYQAGIQLDKEHHADDAELSLPTQIISACAALGYTVDKATALYESLSRAADIGTKTFLEAAQTTFKDKSQRKKLHEEVIKLITKNLANSTSDSFAKVIATSILEAVQNNKGKFTDAKLPLSDSTVFNKMVSTMTTYISNQGIKLKIPGLLAVLTPSHNLFKIYAGRKYESFYNWSKADQELVDKYIKTLNEEQLQQFNSLPRDKQLLEALQFNQKPIFQSSEISVTEEMQSIIDQEISEQDSQIRQEFENQIEQEVKEAIKNEEYNRNDFDLETLILEYLAYRKWDKDKKIKWEGKDGLRAQFIIGDSRVQDYEKAQQYGGKRLVADPNREQYKWMLSDKSGMTFDEFIHEMWEHLLADNPSLSDQDVRNAFLSVIQSANFKSQSEAKHSFQEALKSYILTDTIQQYQDYQQYGTTAEDVAASKGVSMADYLTDVYKRVYGEVPTATNELYKLELGREYFIDYKNVAKDLNGNPIIITIDGKQYYAPANFTIANFDEFYNPLVVTGNSKTTAQVASQIGGIDTLRHPGQFDPFNPNMHFGNPFSHTDYPNTINVGSVKVAVEAYEQWLRGTNYQEVEPERRQWILNQIRSGVLNGKKLVYYTDKIPDFSYGVIEYNTQTAPNHAHILAKLIRESRPERIIYDNVDNTYSLVNPNDMSLLMPVSEQIDTPSQYRQLKKKVQSGEVIKITENIKVGRNLGAYNARFRGSDGRMYQLWDLDNIYYMHEIQQCKTEQDFINWYQSEFGEIPTLSKDEYKKILARKIQIDLMNLSKTSIDFVDQFDKFITHINDVVPIKSSKVQWAVKSNNGYEVSTAGDSRFSALVAKLRKGTVLQGLGLNGSDIVLETDTTIEDIYQNLIKGSGKGLPPVEGSVLYNPELRTKEDRENFSYEKAYLPLWKIWAKQNPSSIDSLRKAAYGKVLTDQFASKTLVSQARALAEILNTSSKVIKIISGGQTGVDQLGLKVGKDLGLETGGTAPKGFKTESGLATDLLTSYGLQEITDQEEAEHIQLTGKTDDYTGRTYLNVRNSDGTIYFYTGQDSAGFNATQTAAKKYNKPFIVNPTAQELAAWMVQNQILVLNVAGNRGSKISPEQLAQYEKTLKEAIELVNNRKVNLSKEHKYSALAGWINSLQGLSKTKKTITIDGEEITITEENLQFYLPKLREIVRQATKVKIGGVDIIPDKSTIQVQPYELIMPKTYIKEFGFTEFTDLNEVQNDPDWFLKQYIENSVSKVEPEQYDVELKRGKGDHIYIIDKAHLEGSGLIPSIGIMTEEVDGKIYRINSKEEQMYELLPGVEIYTDSKGREVIVVSNTDNMSAQDAMDYYIANLEYDNIVLSQNLSKYGDYARDLSLKLQDNVKTGTFFENLINIDEEITTESVLNNFKNLRSNNLTTENYLEVLGSNHYLVKQMRAKHTAFLKSLDIVAARIPSQSLQSFMPMRTVAYDNPNRNAAYVSTLQLLLQGSDLDIDAVSLVMFDIDTNGNIPLWSPYANTLDIDLLNASMELPFPTGQSTNIKQDNSLNTTISIFQDFQSLFDIVSYVDPKTNSRKVRVKIKPLTSPDQVELLSKLLQTQILNMPTDDILEDFITQFNQIAKQNRWKINIKANSKEYITELFNSLKNALDRHNLYLNHTPKFKLDMIINNYAVHALHSVISDPVNQIQAQTSVDETTGRPKSFAEKSEETQASYVRSAGNSPGKVADIETNQVGKDCIGICAVGLKGFFALTEYCNLVLNSGDPIKQQRLLNSAKRVVGKSTSVLLANIRAKDINSITNAEVLDLLMSVKNEDDQALVLSALLSLATDNAKELSLAGLNAGKTMIGTYIYGIATGMDFKDISKLLMSPTARILKEVTDENIMTDKSGYQSFLKAFTYFEKVPYAQLMKFNRFTNYIKGVSEQTPYDFLNRQLQELNGGNISDLLSFIKNTRNLSDVLQALERLRKIYKGSQEDIVKFNQLIDFCQDFAVQYKSLDMNIFNQLKELAGGAEEMRVLGAIVGLNQGIPSDLAGLLNKRSLITNIFENLKVDLQAFAFDENYRQQMIEANESQKHTFNILDVITTVPHVFKYVQLLAVVDSSLQSSFKFRSIESLFDVIKGDFSDDTKTIIRKLNNFLGDYIIQEFLYSQDVQFTLPEGNYTFDLRGIMSSDKSKTSQVIKLGTDYTNATFRKWMEDIVIPDLKQRPEFAHNRFIRDLSNDIRTNTDSGNGMIIYTLPINMLPRTDQDRAVFNQYLDAFDVLKGAVYTYDYIDNRGNKVYTSIPLTNLFALYGLIAHNGRLGESSLMPIFEGIQNQGLFKDLHDFIYDLDTSDRTLSYEEVENRLIPYLASKSPYTSFSSFAWGFNPTNDRFELLSKGRTVHREEENKSIDPGIGNYKFDSKLNSDLEVDPNYFPNLRVFNRSIIFDGNITLQIDPLTSTDLKVQIIYNRNISPDEIKVVDPSKKVSQEQINQINDKLKSVSVQLITQNGKTIPDWELTMTLIDNIINPC